MTASSLMWIGGKEEWRPAVRSALEPLIILVLCPPKEINTRRVTRNQHFARGDR